MCDHNTSKALLLLPDNPMTPIYPIMLAFHGFGSHPEREIAKWKSTAEQQELILVAPAGSNNPHKHQHDMLGWNAIDCCGDPVASKTDDLDFARGIVEAIATIGQNDKDNSRIMGVADASNVVAAGWSNGGFFVSLLALQTRDQRPPWLKGVIPTGGYQYDTTLYDGDRVDPLPIFAHHGSMDQVVRPGGCCHSPQGQPTTTPNCPIQIGSLRDSCVSAVAAFTLWSNHINGCEHDATVTEVSPEGAICMAGSHCRTVTKLCMWPDAANTTGPKCPGKP
jgi:poly(3-hydroxybutyrate) depolymerase